MYVFKLHFSSTVESVVSEDALLHFNFFIASADLCRLLIAFRNSYNVGADLHPNRLTPRFFEKKGFILKKKNENSRRQQRQEQLPSMQRFNCHVQFKMYHLLQNIKGF